MFTRLDGVAEPYLRKRALAPSRRGPKSPRVSDACVCHPTGTTCKLCHISAAAIIRWTYCNLVVIEEFRSVVENPVLRMEVDRERGGQRFGFVEQLLDGARPVVVRHGWGGVAADGGGGEEESLCHFQDKPAPSRTGIDNEY